MADKRNRTSDPSAGPAVQGPITGPAVARDALLPPPKERLRAGFAIAVLVHVLLIVAIAIGVSWKVSEPEGVEAELWSATPQQAAPRANTPPPAPQPTPPQDTPPPPPPPPPAPTPVPKVEPPKPAPPPPTPAVDPQIAIEKEKQRKAELKREEDEAKEADRKALAERRKQDQAKAAKAAADAQAKAEADARAQAEAKAQADKDKREAAEKQAKLDAAKKAADAKAAAALEQLRKDNLARMMAQAGGSGDSRSIGTAAQSSGPSAGYAGRIRARVRPNIIFPDEVQGNPTAEVEVRAGPDGSITSRRITKSSGVPAWDDAVLRALDRTGTLPADTDGRVPPSLLLVFRPRDF